MTTTESEIVRPDMPPLPRVTRSMVFKHFGPNAGRDLLRTEWKDGIDLEVATYALQCFAEDYAAAAVLAERERAERLRAKLQEIGDFAASCATGPGLREALAMIEQMVAAPGEQQP